MPATIDKNSHGFHVLLNHTIPVQVPESLERYAVKLTFYRKLILSGHYAEWTEPHTESAWIYGPDRNRVGGGALSLCVLAITMTAVARICAH